MTADNSPYYAQGLEDGATDRDLLSSCPGTDPDGMNPDMRWSVMYRRGYLKGFDNAVRHSPCPGCKRS